jgi:broad specificity phosphatase PhoE
VKYVYLIRHGQTEWNAEGRWQGRDQAQALAERLAGEGVRAVFASDLERAAETGRILAEACDCPLYVDARLRELHLGVFQGLTHSEIRERYPHDDAQMRANYLDHVVPQGESRRAMQERMLAAWNDIMRDTGEERVAIISHGGAIRILLLRLLPPSEHPLIMTLQISNTACTFLGVEHDGSVHLLVPADHSHLEKRGADKGENQL